MTDADVVDRGVNDNLKFNQETEFVPILGLVADELNAKKAEDEKAKGASSIQDNHHPALLSLLGDELNVATAEIHDFDL